MIANVLIALFVLFMFTAPSIAVAYALKRWATPYIDDTKEPR